MTLRIPNASEEAMLDAILGSNLVLRLFTNDVESGLTDAQIEALALGDFTAATFTGYAPLTLTAGSWVTTPGDDASVATYAPQSFTRVGGSDETVRGYYVTNTGGGGALRWYEYFPGPILLDNIGDSITVTPTFTLDDDRSATVAARGVIARQVLAANSAAYTADATTDFALANVPVDASRLYKVHLRAQIFVSTSALWSVELYVDGVLTDRMHTVNLEASEPREFMTAETLWEPATGTPDLDIRVDEIVAGGNVTFEAAAGLTRRFWVEDVGPR